MPEQTELERDLQQLEAELRRLEAEYNMFFAGPAAAAAVGDARAGSRRCCKRFDRAYIQNSVDRFRFSTLQSRFSTFVDCGTAACARARKGGPGPFSRRRAPAAPPAPQRRRAASRAGAARRRRLRLAARDRTSSQELYESLVEARRAVGPSEPLPFHRFAELVKDQVTKLQQAGSREVAFRVAVKDGKVAFTARGVEGYGTGIGRRWRGGRRRPGETGARGAGRPGCVGATP